MIKRPAELTNASWKTRSLLTLPLVLAEQKVKDPKIGDLLTKVKVAFEKIEWKKLSVEAAQKVRRPATGTISELLDRADEEIEAAKACAEAAEKLGAALKKLVPVLKESAVPGSGLLRKHVLKMMEVNADFINDLEKVPVMLRGEIAKIHAKHSEITLEQVLKDDKMLDEFMQHCEKEMNNGDLLYYLTSEGGGNQEIIDTFLLDGSEFELNAPRDMRYAAIQAGATGVWKGAPWKALRDQALHNVYDPFTRFTVR